MSALFVRAQDRFSRYHVVAWLARDVDASTLRKEQIALRAHADKANFVALFHVLLGRDEAIDLTDEAVGHL